MIALSNSGGGYADVAEFDYDATNSPNPLTLSLKHSRPFVVSGGKLAVSGGASIGADYTGTAAPTNGLIVEGSVGVGTTSPQTNLHVVYPYSKTDTTERFVFETSSNDSSGRHGLKLSSIGGATQDVRKYLLQTHEAGSYNSGILGLQPLGGNVGVGLTSPKSKLDVSGSVGVKVTTVTGNYTAADETVILVNTGTATITLPAASTVTGRTYYIKKISATAGTITIDGNGAETIDGVATKPLTTQYQGMQIVCDGTAWFIVSLK
jgi:hypothetical protein